MSKLREAVAAMKALSPQTACCVEIEYGPVSTVTFCPWKATEWTLPWARLDSMGFTDEVEVARVELIFPHHHVTMVGENLRTILDDIRTFRVSCMRDLPAARRSTVISRAVFISKLDVRYKPDAKNPAPVDVPS